MRLEQDSDAAGHCFDSSGESPDKCVYVFIFHVSAHLESDVTMAGWNMLENANPEYRQDSLYWGGGRQRVG